MQMQITSGKIGGALKVVIYGPEGIGKSTFAAHFPGAVFIDTEGSTKFLDVSRTPTPSSWAMLIEQVQYFCSPHADAVKTLIIDTADWAEQLCLSKICAEKHISGIEDLGYGKGYVYLEEEFGKLLNLLSDVVGAGINVVLTAHAQMRKFEQPDELGAYDRWELKLEKKTAALVKEWADMVLFANYKTLVVNVDNQGSQKGKNKAQGGRRVMYTAHHPCWDAKNRMGLKEELPLDFSEISHCFTSGMSHVTVPEQSQEAEQIHTPKLPPEKTPETKQNEIHMQPDTKDTSMKSPELAALYDLMGSNKVKVEEVMAVTEKKGYYPTGTPIENYDPKFISGVLVGAWPQVFKSILDARELPF